MLNAITF